MANFPLFLQHVLTAYHCVEAMKKLEENTTSPHALNFTAVLGGICLISPEEKPWKKKYGYQIKFKRGEFKQSVSIECNFI